MIRRTAHVGSLWAVKKRRQRRSTSGQSKLIGAERLEDRALLATFTVDTRFDVVDADDGVTSLREALNAANDEIANPGHDTIEFDTSLKFAMIQRGFYGVNENGDLLIAELPVDSFTITSEITIDGSSAGLVRIGRERGALGLLDGANPDQGFYPGGRIFEVSATGNAEIINAVIQGGDSFFNSIADAGAGIRNEGTLTLRDSVVGSNVVRTYGIDGKGGGIYNGPSGVLTLESSHIGEIQLNDDFLASIGVDGEFYVVEEEREKKSFISTLAISVEPALHDNDTDDATRITGNIAQGDGAGIYNEGILNVTLSSVIEGNRTLLKGAGIYNTSSGTVTISDSAIRGHDVLVNNNAGAGIYNEGDGVITSSVIEGNRAHQGGAIYNLGMLSLSETTLSDNHVVEPFAGANLAFGGALFDAGTKTTVYASTFSGNTAPRGGAIYNQSNTDFTLDTSTIANNTAIDGGGLYHGDAAESTFLSSTIAHNTASNQGGGVWAQGTINVGKSIIAENTSPSGADHYKSTPAAVLNSSGFNLIGSSADNDFPTIADATDLIDADAMLGPLGDYGGQTQTVSLRALSPAVNSAGQTGIHFAENEGPFFLFPNITSDNYSIELLFGWNSLEPNFKKIIDFANRTSDNGLYTVGDSLVFYNYGAIGGKFTANTAHHVVLSRDSESSLVTAYLDGTKVVDVVDTQGQAVFGGPVRIIRLFQDDNTTGATEAQAGFVEFVRLYDGPVTDIEAAILSAEALGNTPPAGTITTPLADSFDYRGSLTDQRGEPRVRGPMADRGAFEFQPPSSMRVDTLNGVADGYYAPGETSLADAVDWANAIPGHDTIALSSEFVAELREESDDAVIRLSETLMITDDLTIYGPGADLLSVSGNDSVRVFDVAAGVSVDISGLTIRDGRATGQGAGINNRGELTLTEVVLTGNQIDLENGSGGHGGAIFNHVTGILLVDSSTMHDNLAANAGAGIYNAGGDVQLINATISGNRGQRGGGIYNITASIEIINSTILGNTGNVLGGGIRSWNGEVTIANSIVAKNVSADGPDINSNNGVRSLGSNLIGIDARSGVVHGVNGDLAGTAASPLDPLVGSLRNLGGPTPVHGILPTSPAIDAAFGSLERDQRGQRRPVDDPSVNDAVHQAGTVIDIGAVEFVPPDLPNPIVVDSLDGQADGYYAPGEVSLREAILFANGSAAHNTIVFDEGLFNDEDGQELTSQMLNASAERFIITGDLTILGPAAHRLMITGSRDISANSSSIFTIGPNVTVNMSGMTIARNYSTAGGGIHNQGTLNLDRALITDNEAAAGAGILNDGTLNLTNTTVASNLGSGIENRGDAVLTNATVSGNSANFGGGILNSAGTIQMIHATVANNTGTSGGGFYNEAGATIRFGNSIIAQNMADSMGADGLNNGIVDSLGGNLVGDNSVPFFTPHATDLVGGAPDRLDPFVTPLVTIGGAAISMHALLPGSPAVDLALEATRQPSDQRGVARPTSLADAGAFELEAFNWSTELVVDEFSDELDAVYGPGSLTLREALLWSNVKDGDLVTAGTPDVITFDPDLVASLADGSLGTNTLVLTNGRGDTPDCTTGNPQENCIYKPENSLTIEQDLVVLDPGSVLSDPRPGAELFRISANRTSRVLEIAEGAKVDIAGLTFTNGQIPSNLVTSSIAGGAIYNLGDLTLRDAIVENNYSYGSGGGIYNGNGMLRIDNSTIRGNMTRANGAGIYGAGGGSLVVGNTQIHGNDAGLDGTGSGGGIFSIGPAVIENSAIFDNSAANNGGAIRGSSNPILIANTTISGNQTGGAVSGNENGGAIYSGNLDLYHVTLVNNTSEGQGGGIRSDGHLGIYNSIIAHNSSDSSLANDDDVHASSGELVSLSSIYTVTPANVPLLNATNIIGDPKLVDYQDENGNMVALLTNNGDGTPTHALRPDSPAIDASHQSVKPPAYDGMRLTDQRGRPLAIVKESVEGISALQFNDSAVTLPNSVMDGMNSVLTEFRYRTNKTQAQAIFSAANSATNNEYTIFYLNANTIRVLDKGAATDFTGLPINLADGQWHHIAVARDFIRNWNWLIVDGVSYGNELVPVSTTTLSVEGLILGQDQDNVGGGYDSSQAAVGELDELRIWQGFWPLSGVAEEEALILKHVKQFADVELTGGEPSLFAYYTFNETDGDVVVDGSGGGRDGTLGDLIGSGANARPAPLRNALPPGQLFADIGAYEIQQISSSVWRYEALDQSQFGPGDALVYGFGFDEGDPNSSVETDPLFLGFQFDTGRRTYGKIATGAFNTKFGGEVTVDFAGKLGFDVGFYVNSGSVDVTYDGAVNYVIDAPSNNSADISAFFDVQDGGLYTVSPKIGAFADLILKLDADVTATGCLFGCVSIDLIDIHFDHSEEMFALNRQMKDDAGRTLFLDDFGNGVARDSATGLFYDIDGRVLADQNVGPIIPLFDGDIRYFSIPIEDIAKGVIKAAKTVRQKLNDRKASNAVDEANKEFTSAANRNEQLEDELETAKQQMRNPAGGTAGEVLQAKERVTELAGRDYADRVLAGTENDVPKEGKIKESQDSMVAAHRKRQDAEDNLKQREDDKKKNQKLRSPKAVVGVSLSEAEGSLLGAQVDLEAGFGVGPFNISKNIGSLQVTLPDVNLRDTTVNGMGGLSASTDAFRSVPELDNKRQIANAKLDLASLIPVFPGGKYNISAGPISLDVTTVSYNLGPQLNVTQDVTAMPMANELTYSFFTDTDTPANVKVFVNGLAVQDDNDASDDIGGIDTVSAWTFSLSDKISIDTSGTAYDGSPIRVEPTLAMDARFSNDIGLDVDLDGVFEAFALQLSAFGISIIDIGPLIRHAHTLATFDIGSVFNRTWDLSSETISLSPFTLFDQTMDGRTAATALMAETSASPDVAIKDLGEVSADSAVWVAADLLDPMTPDQIFSALDVEVAGTAVVHSLDVIDQRLTVTPGTTAGSYQITGFDATTLADRSSALFALSFASAGTANVTTTRSAPLTIGGAPETTDNLGGIAQDDFDRAGVSAVLSLDIDQDGIASPLTDGLLLMRHLDGVSGPALVDGVVDINRIVANDRTGRAASEIAAQLPDDIASYIDNVLKKTLLQDPDDPSSVRSSLDLDNSGGEPDAAVDGELFARYIAGFSGSALTQGLTMTPPAEVFTFIETGRTSADNVNTTVCSNGLNPDVGQDPNAKCGFGSVIDATGNDVLALDGVLDADTNDGSSASGAVDPITAAAGASPESAIQGALIQAADLPRIYEFMLQQYDGSVMYEEIYLDGILISRVAEGSPLDFGAEQYAELVNLGAAGEFTKQMGSALLGKEEPIFVRAPDAVGYEYESLGDFTFDTIVIDPQVGGNLLLPSEFDLYLFNSTTAKWEFEATITGKNPAHVGTNGFLTYTFPAGPVSSFRLFSHALPNTELHDAENDVALEQASELFTTTGFLFAEPVGGTAAKPMVLMKPIAERELFASPIPLSASSPVHVGGSIIDSEFRLLREEANIVSSVNSVTLSTFQMAAAETIEVVGHDNLNDKLILSSRGGPMHMPMVFDAGFRDDALIIDPADGAGLTIDLVNRDSLFGVELIDIRGSGSNHLLLDMDAVIENDPFTKRMLVLADVDDRVEIGSGWTGDGNETVDGETYDVYRQASATLLVSLGVPVAAARDADTPIEEIRRAAEFVGLKTKSAFIAPLAVELADEVSAPIIWQPGDAPIAMAADVPAAGDLPLMRQTVSVGSTGTVIVGRPFELGLRYRNEAGEPTTGLHLRVHYDSSQLTLSDLDSVLPLGFSAAQIRQDSPCSSTGCPGFDGDEATDMYVNLLWMDASGQWSPGQNELVELVVANFVSAPNAAGQTTIRFSGNAAAGFELSAAAIDLRFVSGDLNEDGEVGADDIDLVSQAIRDASTDAAFDLNGDGLVDLDDRTFLIEDILGTFLGDGNLDGQVDASDFELWQANLFESGTGWSSGDFNGDGGTDVSDFNTWNSHRFQAIQRAVGDDVKARIPRAPLPGKGVLSERRPAVQAIARSIEIPTSQASEFQPSNGFPDIAADSPQAVNISSMHSVGQVWRRRTQRSVVYGDGNTPRRRLENELDHAFGELDQEWFGHVAGSAEQPVDRASRPGRRQ